MLNSPPCTGSQFRLSEWPWICAIARCSDLVTCYVPNAHGCEIKLSLAQRSECCRSRKARLTAWVDIEITPEIESALSTLDKGDVVRLTAVLVYGRDGSAYTEDGLGAMVRRYCLKAGAETFGLMDVLAKGATDMCLAGVPLERIQMLMGHRSMQTTEIYIKRLPATVSTVAPNTVKMGL